MEKLTLAYEVAKKYHAGQKDRAGKDYIHHVKFVSDQVLPLGETYALVGMLHDTLEDTAMDRENLERLFGKTVAEAVALLTPRQKDPLSGLCAEYQGKRESLCHRGEKGGPAKQHGPDPAAGSDGKGPEAGGKVPESLQHPDGRMRKQEVRHGPAGP